MITHRLSIVTADFKDFYEEIEAKARAESSEAVRDLKAREFKYAMIAAIIARRRELGLTQVDLANVSGVAQTEISRIDRGRKSPTMDTYSKLAAALALDVNIGRAGPRPRRRVA